MRNFTVCTFFTK